MLTTNSLFCVWIYIFGVWTYILGVWTYILGVWTYILGVWTYTLGVRTGGRAGRVTETFGGKLHFGNMYPERYQYCIYYRILTLGYFYKKRRAPENDENRRDKCPEISHMRPI